MAIAKQQRMSKAMQNPLAIQVSHMCLPTVAMSQTTANFYGFEFPSFLVPKYVAVILNASKADQTAHASYLSWECKISLISTIGGVTGTWE